jgi:hypothetical protein
VQKIKVGKPDVTPDTPSHTPGIKQGNERGSYERMPGHNPDGTSTAERSTGINPQLEEPIAPGMPNLSPA